MAKKKSSKLLVGRLNRKTISVFFMIVVILGAAIYLLNDKFSADSTSKTGLTGIAKCQYNMKTGCGSYFSAMKTRDKATKTYLANAADKTKAKALLNQYYTEAISNTRKALLTKDLNQCLKIQEICHQNKEKYTDLVKRDTVDGSTISSTAALTKDYTPKKYTEAIVKLNKDDTNKIKDCRKSLYSKIKSIKQFDYQIKRNSRGGTASASFWGKNSVNVVWAKIARPGAKADYLYRGVNRVNDLSICQNALTEAQKIDKKLSEVVAAGKTRSNTDFINRDHFEKAIDSWNLAFNAYVARIEKILDGLSV